MGEEGDRGVRESDGGKKDGILEGRKTITIYVDECPQHTHFQTDSRALISALGARNCSGYYLS